MQNTENTSINTVPPKKKPIPYKGFPLRQRILPVVLLALAASFTVCFFGPFDIYGNNIDEFRFALTDFLGWSLLYSLLIAALLVAILLPLRGRVFDVTYAVFVWLTLMLFIQGNYLNTGINSLVGDGVGENSMNTLNTLINTVIWVLVGAACIIAILRIPQKHRDTVRLVGIIAMLTVFGMQTVTFAVNSLATDVWATQETSETSVNAGEKYLLTYQNLDKVSTGKNVIYFVIDRFDVDYYEEALEECPELFYNLDGFTYFDDMISLYPRTFPGIAYLITGQEHDFHDTRLDYFKDAYSNSDFLKTLKANNYNVNIYTDTYYGYEDAKYMQEYVSNSSGANNFAVVGSTGIASDMLRISLFRYLPLAAKGLSGDVSTASFDKYVVYDTDQPKYTTDMKSTYQFLMNNPMQTFDGANNFSFIHIAGCHLPNAYDENFNEATVDNKNDPMSAMKQSFKIINRYLDQLKELGLYEDAPIIITGDHCSVISAEFGPLKYSQVTALFVKESGKSGTPLVTNTAPVMQADIFPTILASEGIETDIDFGRTVFEIGEGEPRTRRYLFQSRQRINGEITYEFIEFEVTGRARDVNNWKVVSRGDYVGMIYD